MSAQPAPEGNESGDSSPAGGGATPKKAVRGGAVFIAAGIFLSRIAGLIRSRVFAHYFGTMAEAADAFNAALRIPNFLQNLLGEGVLSASFIPVYARLLGEKKSIEADRVAGVIATLLAIVSSLLALFGVFLAPYVTPLIAPGFKGEKLELTVHCVQILFPSVALLVMSAWCLGVLNSHRRFLLSYVAPVVWNAAIIGALLMFGGRQSLDELAKTACWGLLLGSFLQFAVQLPTVIKLAPELKFKVDWTTENVRAVLNSFGGVVISRGVVQISAYIDMMLASYIAGAATLLTYGQAIYLMPVSLFGMSISAASLTEMSREQSTGSEESIHEKLRTRLDHGLRQIAFFIVPSTAAFVFLGDILGAALFKSGKFDDNSVFYLWFTLAGSGVGLLASTMGRLYSSTFYALRDTRTPLRFALVRVALTTILGALCGLLIPRMLGVNPLWGAMGLTASAGVAGWVEFTLLRRALNRRIGNTGLDVSFIARLWIPAAIAALAGWGMKYLTGHIGHLHPIIVAALVFADFGIFYFGGTLLAGVPQSQALYRNILRRLGLRQRA